jgi:hypothetical protein
MATVVEEDREIERHILTAPPLPDWEHWMEEGVVPALVLGAERRLRREPAMKAPTRASSPATCRTA